MTRSAARSNQSANPPVEAPSVVGDKIAPVLATLDNVVRAALLLGAADVAGWSSTESKLAAAASPNITPSTTMGSSAKGSTAKADRTAAASTTAITPAVVRELRTQIRDGLDPLGEAFSLLRSAEDRRPLGQTYTPAPIVASMVDWAAAEDTPTRVIDPGTGSGRYLLAAGRRFTRAQLIGSDTDPVATLMARANLAAAGLAQRSRVELTDYRSLALDPELGTTLYLGNPPYVRHHQIAPQWKRWLVSTAAERGLTASQLAGLHVHFFLATAESGTPGDYGAFITSSEWMDVNYGRLVRELLLDGLGGLAVHVLDATAEPFADATTTGAITCFRVGSQATSLRLRNVKKVTDLGKLHSGRKIARARLAEAPRWTPLLRATQKLPEGLIELGELARVHRGTVTGANHVWVRQRHGNDLPQGLPERFLKATVTKARELFAAGTELRDPTGLRVVVDLPADLDELDADERKYVQTFLKRPDVAAAREGYIASSRRAWWSVGLRAPAPLLATYMARRPPAFVQNTARARHINIAHGIYPREVMTDQAMRRLADHLRVSVTLGQGRTYAGGLTKFEPREMERLPVPAMEILNAP